MNKKASELLCREIILENDKGEKKTITVIFSGDLEDWETNTYNEDKREVTEFSFVPNGIVSTTIKEVRPWLTHQAPQVTKREGTKKPVKKKI
jgi:hypothetical protein